MPNKDKVTLPPYIEQAAAGIVRVYCIEDGKPANFLRRNNFELTDPEQNIYSCPVQNDQEKAKMFAGLRDSGFYFSFGKELNPSEIFEMLRAKNLLTGTYNKISWQGPGKWELLENC
jgi:hypothetical protein